MPIPTPRKIPTPSKVEMPKKKISPKIEEAISKGIREGSQNRVKLFEDLMAEGLLKKDPVDPIRASAHDLTDDPGKIKGQQKKKSGQYHYEPEYVRSHFKDAMVGEDAENLTEDAFWGRLQDALQNYQPTKGDPRNILVDQYWNQNMGIAPDGFQSQDGVGSVFAGNDAFVMNTHMLDEAMYGTDAAREILTNHAKRNANLKGDMSRGMPENTHRNGNPSHNLTDKWVYHPYTADIRTHGTASPIFRLVQGDVFALPHEAGHMATLDGWRSMPKQRLSHELAVKRFKDGKGAGMWLHKDTLKPGKDVNSTLAELWNTKDKRGFYFDFYPEMATAAREAKFNRIYGPDAKRPRVNTLEGDNEVLDRIIRRPDPNNANEDAISTIFKNLDEKGQQRFRKMWYLLGSNDMKGSLLEEGEDVMA